MLPSGRAASIARKAAASLAMRRQWATRSSLHTPQQQHTSCAPCSAHSAAASSAREAGVLVVGGGIMGLSAAFQLLRSGVCVTLVADEFDATTSHVAGASIAPHLATQPAEQARILKWGRQTLDFLAAHRRELGIEASGVTLASSYEFSHERTPKPYWADMVFGMRGVERGEIEALLGREEAQQYAHGWFFTTLHLDTAIYLAFLRDQVQRMGGVIVPARIHSLTALRVAVHQHNAASSPALDAPAAASAASPLLPLPPVLTAALRSRPHMCVVNCSGLGARELVPDAEVYPCKGIVLRVQNCPPLLSHYFGSELRGSYIIPRLTDATVGGVFGVGDESHTVPAGEFERLVREASKFVPDVARVDREHDVRVMVGHRPNRNLIRLELVQGCEPPTGFPIPITVEQPFAGAYSLLDQAYVDRLKRQAAERLAARSPEEVLWDSQASAKVPVIHNYGHGGSGITLHMGCAFEVCDLVRSLRATTREAAGGPGLHSRL